MDVYVFLACLVLTIDFLLRVGTFRSLFNEDVSGQTTKRRMIGR